MKLYKVQLYTQNCTVVQKLTIEFLHRDTADYNEVALAAKKHISHYSSYTYTIKVECLSKKGI